MLCRKAGAAHFEQNVTVARAMKGLSDVLKLEDQKEMDVLYAEGEAKQKIAVQAAERRGQTSSRP